MKRIVVDVPDIRYEDYVPRPLLPAAWFVTHQFFSVMRLEGQGRLSSDILRRLLGSKSKTIMEQLKSAGLFARERDYSAGLHCREFKFLPPFRSFCCKTITEPKLVEAYARNKINRKSKVHRWLDDILANPSLTFDAEMATDGVDRLTEAEFDLLHKNCSFEDFKMILRHSIHKATHRQLAYANQRLELSTVDEFGLRYHHPFTSLPKAFRGFIRWEGRALVNVDIRNSQPLFLCLAYMDTKGPLTPDWLDYKGECERGRLYETLNQQEIDRDQFKKKFFQEVLFATVPTMLAGEFAKEFKARFPSVFGFILSLKTPAPSRQLRGEDKDRPHRLAAKALQRAESNFMFNGVIPELRQSGATPVIPIHDSILTTPEHAQTVATVIREQFAKLGLSCELNPEST